MATATKNAMAGLHEAQAKVKAIVDAANGDPSTCGIFSSPFNEDFTGVDNSPPQREEPRQ